MYGLPLNHDGPLKDWDELRHYLRRIAESDVAIRVSVGPSADDPYFEARGKLNVLHTEGDAARAVYALNTNRSREEGGLISLRQEDFHGADLLTYDGDDYFHLLVQMDSVSLRLQGTNAL